MRILVVYASKYGSTRGIADRIAQTLTRSGHAVTAMPAGKARELESYDAFVIGSASYMFKWMGEAADFVRHNAELLATRPVWLFSSGPIGTTRVDEQGRDVLETAVPRDIADFDALIHPRGHHVFFGAFDHTRLSVGHRLVYAMPALRKIMVDGDYREWDAIDRWARAIAAELAPVGVPA